MTTHIQLQNQAPPPVSAPPTRASFAKRFLLGLLIVLAIFLFTYALAWYNANQLATRFYQDSEASFKNGDYLRALVGYQTFDEVTNKYVNFGGYLNVEKIWSNRYSWPRPPYLQQAVQRSHEVIYEKLTVEQAEQYIVENTGRPGAPYFAEIYLRLGELYEQNGDTRDALDVYESYPSLFPNRKDLIEQAQQHLERLQSQEK